MSTESTLVSVIIASHQDVDTIPRCLEALRCQEGAGPYEVIVGDSSTDGTADLVATRFPDVKVLRSAERLAPGAARNLAIRSASGEIFAFTDADCIPPANWIATIRESHRSTAPAIGGVVANANPASYVGWGYYFCKFSLWMPGTVRASRHEVPTTCLSVKRWAWEAFGPFRETGYSSDTDFNWRMAQAGHAVLLEPSMRVAHVNIERFAEFASKLYEHARAFARVRVRLRNFSRRRRFAYVLLSPLLPVLLFTRTLARVANGGVYVREFVRAAPIVLVGYAIWSAGEVCGYLTPVDRAQ